jgi:alpha-beta hydrolase superfamily lysophospholipase
MMNETLSKALELESYRGVDGRPLRYGLYRNPQNTSGKALLFIPGLGGSVKGALGFLECLLPHYNVIYGPDLRSFGLNAYEETEETLSHIRFVLPDLEAFHEQVLAEKIASGEIHDLTLCGISLGGVLATLLADAQPERYQRLVLLAPAYKPHPRSFSIGYTVRNILAFLLKGGKGVTQIPYGITELTSNEALLNDPVYRDQLPLQVSRGLLLGIRGLCGRALKAVRRLRLPTMIVVPGKDVICDPRTMRQAFANIPSDTPKFCQEYPDFYHDVLFESGHPKIAEDMLAWITRLEKIN